MREGGRGEVIVQVNEIVVEDDGVLERWSAAPLPTRNADDLIAVSVSGSNNI